VAVLACALGAAGGEGPGVLTSAKPAAAVLPDYTNNCNIQATFCNILAQYAPTQHWAYGTAANQGIISNSHSSQWTLNITDSPWGALVNKDGNCLNWAASIDQLVTSSCQFNNHNELFWIFHPSSYPNGSYAIKNYSVGTGPNFWIDNVDNVYVQFVGANNAGTELTLRA